MYKQSDATCSALTAKVNSKHAPQNAQNSELVDLELKQRCTTNVQLTLSGSFPSTPEQLRTVRRHTSRFRKTGIRMSAKQASKKIKDLPDLQGQKVTAGNSSKFSEFLFLGLPLGMAGMAGGFRKKSGFPSDGNFASLWALNRKCATHLKGHAFSKFPDKAFNAVNGQLSLPPGMPEKKCHCTEFQLLNALESTNSQTMGDIDKVGIYTERFPCESCTQVILNYRQRWPKVALSILFSFYEDAPRRALLTDSGVTVREVPVLDEALTFSPEIGQRYVFDLDGKQLTLKFVGPTSGNSGWEDESSNPSADPMKDSRYFVLHRADRQSVPGTLRFLIDKYATE